MSGYPTKPLGELCTFLNGLWIGKKPPFEPAIVFRNTNFRPNGRLDDSNVALLDVETRQLAKRKLVPGDIIIEKSGGGPKQAVGRVAYFDKVGTNFSFSNFTSAARVADRNEVDPQYLTRFLDWCYVSGITEGMQSHSTGIRNLDFNAYKAIEVPLPVLSEQRRVVAVLNEAFAAIATATANAEKNLANAREALLDAMDRELAAGGASGIETTLEAICSQFEYGTSAKSKPAGRVPVLRMGNLQNSEIDWSDLVYTDDSKDIEKFLIKPMDVLFNRTNSLEHVGKSAIVRDSRAAIFAGYLIRLHYCAETVDPEFLNIYLNSRAVRNHGRALAGKSVNQANISAGKLRTYPIHLPPLVEQKRTVLKVSKIRDFLERMQAIQKLKLEKLAALKQAMLDQAFRGELTATVPKALAA